MNISLFSFLFFLFLGGILADCPNGFDPIGDQCIYAHKKKKLTWHEAEIFCQYKESHLWTPKDDDFNPFKKKEDSIWIGGYLNPDSKWQWINGSLITDIDYFK